MSRTSIESVKRIVVKVGTSSLILPNGKINLRAIDQIAFTLTSLNNQGYEVILVSSGAIGAGLNLLGLNKRPSSIAKQQAAAAIGQSELIKIYNQRFQHYHQISAQVLLTRDVVDYPESRANVINTLYELVSMKVIPIVNENDSVAVDELDHLTKFGDNDQLSAIVASLSDADLLIMLSDIDGFFSDNPQTNPDAVLYNRITEINQSLENSADGAGSRFGTGGMSSKLKAAEHVFHRDSQMVLANGKNPSIIFDILEGKKIGTLFASDTHSSKED
ncbi:glutamate 5-kinase [Vagococcus hydrophili]|uniref:Glutamate 5-kinase n=1 Tax=Vagococcus hydrophili TaxID=2714947 RepID=A0A6G8ATH3_9ENTE|nr:glutamate 5-kinase [Vagococcus hydrophili]QIL48378.1 glutamate 5-kinase [Vagococcus hydrophili]